MIQQKNGTPKIRWLKQVLKPHAPHHLRAEKITGQYPSFNAKIPNLPQVKSASFLFNPHLWNGSNLHHSPFSMVEHGYTVLHPPFPKAQTRATAASRWRSTRWQCAVGSCSRFLCWVLSSVVTRITTSCSGSREGWLVKWFNPGIFTDYWWLT